MTRQMQLLGAPWRQAPSHDIVAWDADRGAPALDQAGFHQSIGAWQYRLDELAPTGQSWLLYHRDPVAFAAALIALWERGDSAVLPADDRPETLDALSSLVTGRLGDVAQGHQAGAPQAPRWGHLCADRVAVTLFTSGSTGAPKQLDKTFAQLDAELSVHRTLWPLDGRLVISQVSHQHIYGLLFAILRPLCEGAPMASRTCRYPETLSAWLQHLCPSREASSQTPRSAVLISAPPPLERLPIELDWQRASERLARIHSSGAPLSAAASAHARAVLGVGVSEIYGSSETGGIAWRDQQVSDHWTPLPGIEVRDDAEGRLWLRSPFLPDPGAWECQADRIAPVSGGFRLLGRRDRIAKVGGKRLSLSAMDHALQTCHGVLQARALPLAARDNRLGAIIQLRAECVPYDHAARRDLIQALRNRLLSAFEPTVIPRYWRFVEAWPTNTQGKLSTEIVAQLFADLKDRRLPRWLGSEADDAQACRIILEVPERLVYCQGHFPEQPVVPGVVMLQWAIDLARRHLGVDGTFQRLERVKFPQLLLPGDRVSLSLTWHPDSEGGRLAFDLSGRRGCHAYGRMRFAMTEVSHAS
ncbi:AMP-binding protein [Modicisalibacter xianhensis]|uniref:Acyl-coenzyme A synthetase/AMP-(Fatty) acid ligase n=1 Tax=Modicisalibacter xianhensis TaxID=442341 RepID=A0A1I2XX83_9GAMM|nr:AMP-binding protein [Halomonas xianhensis]SFH18025.1 Acyl-coenzyme A synthetase/AMP-(fatty) acid ligase [Halomonas xianhensis]